MDITAVLIGLFGPFLVWPLEKFLPYPHIIEELFKVAVVYFILKSKPTFKDGLKSAIFAGISFAATETALYSLNINAYGSISLLFTRFFTTSLLHCLTFAVIYLSGRRNWGLLLGFAAAILIHYFYNLGISN